MFNIRIIADCSSSVSGEFLVDSLERGVSLSLGFLDTVLMVFVVLIFRGMILIFSHCMVILIIKKQYYF